MVKRKFKKNHIKLSIIILAIILTPNCGFCETYIGNKSDYTNETAEGIVADSNNKSTVQEIAPVADEENTGPTSESTELVSESVIGKELYLGPTVITVETTKHEGSLDAIIKEPTIRVDQETTPQYLETSGIQPTAESKQKYDKYGNPITEEKTSIELEETWETYNYNSITQYGVGNYNSPGMVIHAALKNPLDEESEYYDEVYQGLGIDAPSAVPKYEEDSSIVPEEHTTEYYQTITNERLIKDYIWEQDNSNRWYLRKFLIDNYVDTNTGKYEEYFTGWQRIPYTEKIYDMWRYFDPETKAMSIGWKKCPLITDPTRTAWFFFHPVVGCMQRGWLNYAGKRYYLNSDDSSPEFGTMLEGFWKIGNIVYYFERGSGEISYEMTLDRAIRSQVPYKEMKQ